MDFDKDEIKLNAKFNNFENMVAQMRWIEQEIELSKTIIRNAEKALDEFKGLYHD